MLTAVAGGYTNDLLPRAADVTLKGAPSADDLLQHNVGKVLDQFGIEHRAFKRWSG